MKKVLKPRGLAQDIESQTRKSLSRNSCEKSAAFGLHITAYEKQ